MYYLFQGGWLIPRVPADAHDMCQVTEDDVLGLSMLCDNAMYKSALQLAPIHTLNLYRRQVLTKKGTTA